ncbi:MAG: LptF/LptG family permease [Bacteroidota bacterium]|nr:LptF/LptG family permease [Bacteroidota bacterium]
MKKRWYEFGYQIDRMLITSFIPPFIGSFLMALFVLIMQFLWKFIEDILGKGIEPLVVLEMFFYKSVSLFPLALPIAVLLAAVMVTGNLAEQFELSSFKSAGVSLLRVLLPLIFISSLVGLFSFYCSNTIIPIANLKYQSRLYDIRNQKPTLSIEPGIFNEDFKGYAIRVGKKHRDKETIEDVMVYDDSQRNRGEMNVVTAQRGRMYVSGDDGAFVMTLYDGYQYSEAESNDKPNSLPFTISHFKEWTRRFDLSEFDFDRTEEEQFKNHHLMKSARQIAIEIDTLDEQIQATILTNINPYRIFQDTSIVRDNISPKRLDTINVTPDTKIGDIIKSKSRLNDIPHIVFRMNPRYERIKTVLDSIPLKSDKSILAQLPVSFMKQWNAQVEADINVRKTSIERNERTLERLEITRRKHVYQFHWKFSLALACVVMMMIGGPMGTIVRKGGFGYPLLISIFFFTFFIMSNISCQKLNDSQTMNPVLAAWMPVMLLGAISIFLTYKALNDSKVMDVEKMRTFFIRLLARRKKEVVA